MRAGCCPEGWGAIQDAAGSPPTSRAEMGSWYEIHHIRMRVISVLLIPAARAVPFHRAGSKPLRYLRNVICSLLPVFSFLCNLLWDSRSGPASSRAFSCSELAWSDSSLLITCISLINVRICFTRYVCGKFVRPSGHRCLLSPCWIKRGGFWLSWKREEALIEVFAISWRVYSVVWCKIQFQN